MVKVRPFALLIFKQELPEFDEDMRVLDYIREDHSYMVLGDGSTLSAGQILERFLFTPELHGVPIRKLSGGELVVYTS